MTHPISISFPNSEFSKTYVGIFAQVTPAVDLILCLKNNVSTLTAPIEQIFGKSQTAARLGYYQPD